MAITPITTSSTSRNCGAVAFVERRLPEQLRQHAGEEEREQREREDGFRVRERAGQRVEWHADLVGGVANQTAAQFDE